MALTPPPSYAKSACRMGTPTVYLLLRYCLRAADHEEGSKNGSSSEQNTQTGRRQRGNIHEVILNFDIQPETSTPSRYSRRPPFWTTGRLYLLPLASLSKVFNCEPKRKILVEPVNTSQRPVLYHNIITVTWQARGFQNEGKKQNLNARKHSIKEAVDRWSSRAPALGICARNYYTSVSWKS